MLTSGWNKDEADKCDDKNNKRFTKQKAVFGNSLEVEFIGPLYFELFNQDRTLISQVDMRFKLQPDGWQ